MATKRKPAVQVDVQPDHPDGSLEYLSRQIQRLPQEVRGKLAGGKPQRVTVYIEDAPPPPKPKKKAKARKRK